MNNTASQEQACEECGGSGMVDTSGFGDFDACDECHGSGRATPPLASSPPAGEGALEVLKELVEAREAHLQKEEQINNECSREMARLEAAWDAASQLVKEASHG